MGYHVTESPGCQSTGNRVRCAKVWRRVDWLALVSLVGMCVALFWRLALTDLIIGRGDLFFYFYPYRDYASAAVKAGRIALWNPYLFMGAPFLANSQVGFFYPLNLVMAWYPVEQMVNASIVLHASLAAIGAFWWGRGRLGLSRLAAGLTGLCYGLGGYFVAQVEHLNQVQVLAWLPWLLWLFRWRGQGDAAANADRISGGLRFSGLALVIAMQFLAGHTQSVFICLVGLTGYAVLPVAWNAVRQRGNWRSLVRPIYLVVGATLLGGALAAVQLLPTFELSRLSVRSGGLPYKEAVSFSLRPELIGRALLPSWGVTLFPEFVAYVGVAGLGLAVAGALVRERYASLPIAAIKGSAHRSRQMGEIYLARRGALVLAVLGLFLALGGFNPIYFMLVKLVPGFGLFRVPARWLALYAIGVSGLAGVGLDGVSTELQTMGGDNTWRGVSRGWSIPIAGWIVLGGLLAGLVLVGQLFGDNVESHLAPPLGHWSVVGWLAAALVFGAVLSLGFRLQIGRSPRLLKALLIALVAVELLGGSTFLPLNRATAQGALMDLRPAVAHLLGEANTAEFVPPARFLSISGIFFDPGDKEDIEITLGPQLSTDAVYDYVIATKQKEVLIPNLALYYRLPTIDGYDGGVLPLRRYVTLERLYMPQDRVAIDGRLRENLEAVPDGRWLSLFNVRFVITDKVGDAWSDDVFYDLQMGARLHSDAAAAVGHVPKLPSTALGVVYRADGAATGTRLADLDVVMADGRQVRLALVADSNHASFMVGGVETGDRVARLTWGQVDTPAAISVRGAWHEGAVVIRGLSLIDERTGVFRALVLSDSGRYRLVHSGDVKIYENLDVLPRAFFVSRAIAVRDDETALNTMRDPTFDPTDAVVLLDGVSLQEVSQTPKQESLSEDQASIEFLLYEPERIVVNIIAPSDGWLVLTDAWYPGWEARIDDKSVRAERVDILFRAVAVAAGEHQVEWIYRPTVFRLGVAISLCTVGLLLVGGVWKLMAWRMRD